MSGPLRPSIDDHPHRHLQRLHRPGLPDHDLAPLGFFFLPLTTLAYAWAINSHGSVSGLPLAVVILAVLIDLGIIGSGAHTGKKHRMTSLKICK